MVMYEKVCTGAADLWISIVSVLLGQKDTSRQNEAVHNLQHQDTLAKTLNIG